MAELFEVAELAGVTDVADVQRYCDEQARHILTHCDARGLKIACAESLTAGLLADSFVRIPGASSVFLGSAVTYDIHAKATVLGIDAELLRTHGAVDPEVARQMARRAAHLFTKSNMRMESWGCLPLVSQGRARTKENRQEPCISASTCHIFS